MPSSDQRIMFKCEHKSHDLQHIDNISCFGVQRSTNDKRGDYSSRVKLQRTAFLWEFFFFHGSGLKFRSLQVRVHSVVCSFFFQ
jgi:hypothetical protein